ncbi:MAG: hypothetical protein VX507_00515 [Gemmatimonadota bacterium]|nr:hypothetical protein [Gemmatimonadota bacterium]
MDIEILGYLLVFLWFVFGSLLNRKQKNQRAQEPVELEWDQEEQEVWSEEPLARDSGRERKATEILPADLWEEITGAMRLPEPEPVEETPLPEREPVRTSRKRQLDPSIHPIHSTHPEYGTDPSERTASIQHGLGSLTDTLELRASVARDQLGLGDRKALRKAVILHEVLGPPLALREQQQADTITSRLWPSF